MYRIDNSTAAAALPAASAPGAHPNRYFTDGDPATGTPATVVPAEFLNMLQEEIALAVLAGGLTLDKSNRGQLAASIAAQIVQSAHAVIIQNAVFAAGVADGHVVRWDADNTRYDKALADGSTSNRAVGIADVTNAQVVAFGASRTGLFSGLTPGARYYLSGTTPGAMTATAPADVVILGIATAADQMFVDIDLGTTLSAYARLDTAQVWTKQQSGAVLALTFGTSIDWNLNDAQTAKVTLTGNATLAAPTNQTDGGYYSLRVTQDATGSRTLAYNAAFKGVTGVALSTAANAVDHLVFRSTGIYMELVAVAKNVGA